MWWMPTMLISTAETFAASRSSSRPASLAHLFMLAEHSQLPWYSYPSQRQVLVVVG